MMTRDLEILARGLAAWGFAIAIPPLLPTICLVAGARALAVQIEVAKVIRDRANVIDVREKT